MRLKLFGILWLSFCGLGLMTNDYSSKLLTSKYAGLYSYGTDIEKGGIGTILIYPETDSTVLFYIDLNRGAPSYNMGSLYGRVKITDGKGTFYAKTDLTDQGCKWSFQFNDNSLVIKTIDDQYECGFGGLVYADGTYNRTSTKTPEYFENGEGIKGLIKISFIE